MRRNYFPQWGHAKTSGGWIQWLSPAISLCCKQTKHTKQQSTCSAGPRLSHAARLQSVSKLPMHLIRAPLGNNSPYHRSSCPRRYAEQEVLWLSRLEPVRDHAVCIVWQGTAREQVELNGRVLYEKKETVWERCANLSVIRQLPTGSCHSLSCSLTNFSTDAVKSESVTESFSSVRRSRTVYLDDRCRVCAGCSHRCTNCKARKSAPACPLTDINPYLKQ